MRRVSRTLGAVRSSPRRGLRVLLYHGVGAPVPGDGYGMSVTSRAFAEQMHWLREESGYAIVSLGAAAEMLAGGDIAGTAVAVTFDDGFIGVLTDAAPVLVRFNIPFSVFVVGGYLERSPLPGLYLDARGVRELATLPLASIGAHGFTHRPLTRLGEEDLDTELRASRDAVGECVGKPPSAISYPHGAVNHRVRVRARAAGFLTGVTSVTGVNRRGTPQLSLRRTEIVAGDTAAEFSRKVRGDYDWYGIRQRLFWRVPVNR